METIFGFVAPLLMLAIAIAIIAAIVSAARRSGDGEEEEPGIGMLRRVFYYLLGFIALSVASAGVCLLLGTLLEPLFGKNVIITSGNRLALSLALTIVGTPIWLFLWGRAQQAAQRYPVETRTLGRKLSIYLVLGISAAIAAGSLVNVVRWAFRIQDDPSLSLAILLVMAGVWVFHWRADTEGRGLTVQADGPRQSRGAAALMPRLYIYVTSLYSLVMLAPASGVLLYKYFLGAYEAFVQTPILGLQSPGLWSRGVREALSLAIVGGLWWWAHWKYLARKDQRAGLRQVYLYIFAVFGGAVTVVASLATFFYGVLSWLAGVPGLPMAAEHFRFVPAALAAFVIGAALWGYHYSVIAEETPGSEHRFIGPRRGYQYLIAAVGLGTLAVGLVIAFGVALGELLPKPPALVATPGGWKKQFALAITLIAVGAPLWGYFWSGLQREAKADPAQERTRLSRRIFIYAVFGIALLITLGNLSALLFTVLKDALNGSLSAQSFQDARWFAGSLLMAGAISIYYGLVLGEDRRAREAAGVPGEVPRAPRKRVTAVAPEQARDHVRAVEASLGYPVTWWKSMDGTNAAPAVTEADLAGLPQRIAEAPSERVLLVFENAGFRVLPYRAE